jgi:CheY-like chemotaxis protein
MNRQDRIYEILRDVVNSHSERDPGITPLPAVMAGERKLTELGIDITTLPEIARDLKDRLGGKDLRLDHLYNTEEMNLCSISGFLSILEASLSPSIDRNLVVYVDDEEENIFVFKRQFGKSLNLKTFTNPTEALRFIKSNEEVGLVITDEVMPGLRGNELCDEVQKVKPNMKFILITGNPNQDADLMYSSLRGNRFFDFLQKPVDFSARGGEILNMIQGIIHFSW